MKSYHDNPNRPFREPPECYLMYWGKENCTPNHSYGPGAREWYKVHFIHEGTGSIRVGSGGPGTERSFQLNAGQAFLMVPQHPIFYQADERTPWTYSWIAFRGDQVESILSRTRITADSPVFPMDKRLMPNLYDLLNQAAQQEHSGGLRLTALLLEFLSQLTELMPASKGAASGGGYGRKDEYVQRCLEFLHSHYGEEVSIGEMSSMLGLDRKYVSAIFKEATGLPPQQYLLHYRLNRACELLRNKQKPLSVAEVARTVGYPDALLFSKMFKKVKGLSPKHYQQMGNQT